MGEGSKGLGEHYKKITLYQKTARNRHRSSPILFILTQVPHLTIANIHKTYLSLISILESSKPVYQSSKADPRLITAIKLESQHTLPQHTHNRPRNAHTALTLQTPSTYISIPRRSRSAPLPLRHATAGKTARLNPTSTFPQQQRQNPDLTSLSTFPHPKP